MDYKGKKKFYKNNKSNAYHKCGRIGHYARDCKVKDKIKSLDLEDNIKDSLYKILLNSFRKIIALTVVMERNPLQVKT
ncbi:hypothetical protein H5410_064956 [Solanum commersonii]|uniref:CCHC-type domain-containing protein n=1 Tax=Solanum commersonii TaxID=4109 RepID=A0A9J5VXX4_SOLCO|nr:hypothetical protein H5410_064956 [Solanum commersonii]